MGCSVMSDSAIPWTVDCEAPLSVGFPRQKYWSRLPQKNIICRIKQSLTFLSPPLSPTPFSHTSLILLRLFSCLDISLLRDILYHSWVLHGEPQL